ncbi:MAG: imelysin family protein [Candidatus Azotimanducaceae bacterium]|uniref:Imelysin-like domain-containing protein n=1 Tax=OM182 bacterium TaxID=2510334 RepID=A0A520RX83_9GAMM|nr:MAG: hypothetical protein EVA68_08300 [OM182 bacterium]
MIKLFTLILAISFTLVGCGGGGSGGSESSQSPIATSGTGSSGDDASSDESSSDDASSDESSSDDASSDDASSTMLLLNNLATNIFIPNYTSLVTSAGEFSSESGALETYCSSIGTAEEATALADAQSTWQSVMADVQATELHAVGPAIANGEILRKRMISFSDGALSTCGIDEIAVLASEADFNINSRASNQLGMGAAGYLLFNEDLNHSCSALVPTTANWNALSNNERKAARCEAAKVIVTDVKNAAEQIASAWDASGGNFIAEYSAEGTSGQYLQDTTDALFYIEMGGKDKKLNIPLGLRTCTNNSCPESVESKYSKNSLQNIKSNALAFLEIFEGGTGRGFDDVISEAGFPEVNQSMQTAVADIISAIDTIDTPLYEQALSINTSSKATACTNASSNPGTMDLDLPACTLAGLMKRVTDIMKLEFVTIVNINLPSGVQSDTD